MRLAIVTWRDLTHPLAGGSEVLTDQLARGFAERGNDVTVVCGGPVDQDGADGRPYAVVEAGGTFSQYIVAPYLCRRLRNVDLLIDVENGMPYFSPLWHRGAKVCLVHHVHTDQWRDRFAPPLAAIARAVEARAMPLAYRKQTFVAVSPSTCSALVSIGVPADHIRVIENGVSPRSPAAGPGTRPAKSPSPLFVAVGRLVPHKRIDLLLETWEQVRPETGGRLVVVGDGPEMAKLRRSLPEGAELAGRVSDRERDELMAAAWLLVHCAHHEGWGMTVLEAAAAGTPALALDAPGVRDAIVDGTTGELACDPADMMKRWTALASNPERRAALGEAARERAASMSWDRTVGSYLELAVELAGGKGAGGKKGAVEDARAVRGGSGPIGRAPATQGLRRSAGLFRAFLHQFDDEDAFYRLLAADTVGMVARYAHLGGARVLDVGGGSGYFARAFGDVGSRSAFVEIDWEEMHATGEPAAGAILADARRLPFADASFDVTHSSNVIEHMTNPRAMFDEMLRVVRPGGVAFLAFTNWWSPFGGHETSPWHWLGGEAAARRYESRHGHPPKNRFGTSLFPLHVAEVLRFARERDDAEVIEALPRYYPRWVRSIVKVPVVREVATWNLALAMRKH